MDSAKFAWATAKKKLTADPAGDVRLSPKLAAIIDASFENTRWENVVAHLSNPATPFTLCHGDFHAANMFLRAPPAPAEGYTADTVVPARPADVLMFDWSEIGPWEGAYDLAQMIISDVRASVFKTASRDAVRVYWEALTAPGEGRVDPAAYTFDACWSAFCRGGPERWIWFFVILSCFPVPSAAVQYFHDQLLEFIESHEPQPFYELKSIVWVDVSTFRS